MNYLTKKTATVPDLFGGSKHVFTSPDYGAWIIVTQSGLCYVTIFCHNSGIMLSFEDSQQKVKEFESYNVAYIWMLLKIELLRNSKK